MKKARAWNFRTFQFWKGTLWCSLFDIRRPRGMERC